MAFVQNTAAVTGGTSPLSGLAALRDAYSKWRLYRRTIAELQALPQSMLSDIGIGKGEIQATARQAVYGGRV